MAYESIYIVEFDPSINVMTVRYRTGGLATKLYNGNMRTIAAIYMDARKKSLQLADFYIHGILAGLTHVVLTGEIPSIRDL